MEPKLHRYPVKTIIPAGMIIDPPLDHYPILPYGEMGPMILDGEPPRYGRPRTDTEVRHPTDSDLLDPPAEAPHRPDAEAEE